MGLLDPAQPMGLLAKNPQGAWNTKLNPEQEAAFQAWLPTSGINPLDLNDYDLRGYWMGGGANRVGAEHLTDAYKKPNHPTFSTQSLLGAWPGMQPGAWSQVGGQDAFRPGPTNLQVMPYQALQDYFRQYEPGVRLLPPRR